MQQAMPALEAEAVVDRAAIGGFQIFVWCLGTSVIFMDGFNIQVMGYIMPRLVKDWHIPHTLIGPIASSGLLGVLAGYLLISPFANRVGHRRMMIWSTLFIGIFTLGTIATTNAYSMMAMRFLTGIALGGSNPSAVLVISDLVPKRVRSTFVAASIVGVSLGSMVAGLVSVAVLQRFGWQGVLWVGGLAPLALTAVLFAGVPDTFHYLITHRHDQAGALQLARRTDPSRNFADGTQFLVHTHQSSSSVAQLFTPDRVVGTIGIWISFSANLLVFFFIQSWLAQIIVQYGHSQRIAITATSVLLGGGVCSILIIGPLMDRFSPYKVLAAYFLIAGATVALLGSLLAGSIALIMGSAFLVGLTVLGLQKGMNAVCVHFYEGELRATGLGWGLGIGRLGAVIGPTLAGALMQAHLPTPKLFYLAAAPLLLACIAQFIMSRVYSTTPLDHGSALHSGTKQQA